MTVDAAPVLLDLAKTAPSDKYQVRALRGYIRLARQFAMPDEQRAEMCQKRAGRLESRRRTEAGAGRARALSQPGDAQGRHARRRRLPALKEDATRVALVIIQKLGDKAGDARELLAKIGLEPVKVEIIKAEYGAGTKQKDVTEALQQHVRRLAADYLAVAELQRQLRRRPGARNRQETEDPVPDQRQGGRGIVRRKRDRHAADAEVVATQTQPMSSRMLGTGA